MALTLGSVTLDGFEVNAGLRFGGAQSLAVHRLPGGTRVIDAMGPDDDTISWHGILSGSDATDRARMLDALRVAGLPVNLAWDVFAASVIVSRLTLVFCSSWWVPYRISCTVMVGVETPVITVAEIDAIGAVLADLGLAALAPGVGNAASLVAAPGATSAGSQAFAAAGHALSSAGANIAQAIGVAEMGMTATDLPSLVANAGSLASLTAAAGYVGRAATNFSELGA